MLVTALQCFFFNKLPGINSNETLAYLSILFYPFNGIYVYLIFLLPFHWFLVYKTWQELVTQKIYPNPLLARKTEAPRFAMWPAAPSTVEHQFIQIKRKKRYSPFCPLILINQCAFIFYFYKLSFLFSYFLSLSSCCPNCCQHKASAVYMLFPLLFFLYFVPVTYSCVIFILLPAYFLLFASIQKGY